MPDIRPVRIEPDLYELITFIAEAERRSVTKQVNHMLRQMLQASKEQQ